MFSQELYREVKRNLRPGHKGNPEVRFEIKIDEDVYDIICMYGIDSKARGTKFVTGLQNNREFDSYLGKRWDRRIINKQGDFVYVANGSVRFWKLQRQTIKDYFEFGGKFFPYEIEQTPLLVFTFIRLTGNKRQYIESFAQQ